MTELERGETSPLACLRPYGLMSPGVDNKVKKRIRELTLEECRVRALVFETSDGDDHRILTLKLGKKVLSLEQIAPQCSRLRVPRHQVQHMTSKLLGGDAALLEAQQAQSRS